MTTVAARTPTFAPARHARPLGATRLLVVRKHEAVVREASFGELPRLLAPGDVMVVNDAATLPASVFGETALGAPIELRLLGLPNEARECDAVTFGAGDWRTPTEQRAQPPSLAVGDTVHVGRGPHSLEATVIRSAHRRVALRFERGRDDAVASLYDIGRPVQYAHIEAPLPLWDVQNVYAAEPWAAEMPSAGRPLDFATLDALRKRGIAVVRLTHGAGLSSTGDAVLDAELPWTERYRIPEGTAEAVAGAKRNGKRIIAVGTSVVRALESSLADGGSVTTLRIDARHRLRVVTALLTGMHDTATSHADLLAAFLSPDLLAKANRFAAERGFLGHELGDSCLILDA